MTITCDPLVLEFIDERIGLGKPFKDRTHAFEYAVAQLMEAEERMSDEADRSKRESKSSR